MWPVTKYDLQNVAKFCYMIVCTLNSAYSKKMQQHGQPCEIYIEILVSLSYDIYQISNNETSKREIQRSKTAGEWLPRSKRNIEWLPRSKRNVEWLPCLKCIQCIG